MDEMENEYDSSTIMALIGMMMTKALEEIVQP